MMVAAGANAGDDAVTLFIPLDLLLLQALLF
jgi:hypothetical protein